jgi:hypothetical protein
MSRPAARMILSLAASFDASWKPGDIKRTN